MGLINLVRGVVGIFLAAHVMGVDSWAQNLSYYRVKALGTSRILDMEDSGMLSWTGSVISGGYSIESSSSIPFCWQNSNAYRVASSEVYAAQKITLYPGRNWVSLPVLPPQATVSNVFGYYLPAGDSPITATKLQFYNASDNIQSTCTLWLASGDTRHWMQNGEYADDFVIPEKQGILLQLPEGAPCTFTAMGKIRTNNLSILIKGGGAENFVNVNLPGPMHPKDMNLLASGFQGSYRAMRSDRIYLWDNEHQVLKDYVFLWYRTTDGAWYTSANERISDSATPIHPNDGFLIQTAITTEDWVWQNIIDYNVPTRTMNP